MSYIRSLVFNIYLFGGTFVIAFGFLVLTPFSNRMIRKGSVWWTKYIMFGLKYITGIRYELRGLDRLPAEGGLIACKHQSAWDTAIFLIFREMTAYIMKKELLKIPFYGWYVRRAGHIAVDRDGGAAALKEMVAKSKTALDKGRTIVIFPEGTRSHPGEAPEYHPGVAALYSQTKQPVYPVALNSGLYWGRRSFVKSPGTIILEVLPPIEPGLKRREFMERLQNDIETKTRELEAEGRQRDFSE